MNVMDSVKTDYHDNVPPFHTCQSDKIWHLMHTIFLYCHHNFFWGVHSSWIVTSQPGAKRSEYSMWLLVVRGVCRTNDPVFALETHVGSAEPQWKAQEIRHHCTCSLQSTNALLKLDSRLKPTEIIFKYILKGGSNFTVSWERQQNILERFWIIWCQKSHRFGDILKIWNIDMSEASLQEYVIKWKRVSVSCSTLRMLLRFNILTHSVTLTLYFLPYIPYSVEKVFFWHVFVFTICIYIVASYEMECKLFTHAIMCS